MDLKKQNMIERMKNAFSNPKSEISISSTENENKIQIKNNQSVGLNAKKILMSAWSALAISGVAVVLLTVPEFVHRADTISDFIKSGKMDVKGQMIDDAFYNANGANFVESFNASVEKLSHAFTKNNEVDAKFEKGLTGKPLQFLSTSDLIQKVEDIPSLNDNVKKSTLK